MSIGRKIFDDILGIDPSGQGIVGSIRDNPLLGAAGVSLLGPLIPGIGGLFTSPITNAGVSGLLGSVLSPANLVAGSLISDAIVDPSNEVQPPSNFQGIPILNPSLLSGNVIGQSGLDYARQVSGGIPFEQIVQPGMEFSLAQPMGQTDIQPIDQPPAVPPAPIIGEPVPIVAPINPLPVPIQPIDPIIEPLPIEPLPIEQPPIEPLPIDASIINPLPINPPINPLPIGVPPAPINPLPIDDVVLPPIPNPIINNQSLFSGQPQSLTLPLSLSFL